MQVVDKLIRELESTQLSRLTNFDLDYLRSVLKAFSQEQKGVMFILNEKNEALTISQIRSHYFLLVHHSLMNKYYLDEFKNSDKTSRILHKASSHVWYFFQPVDEEQPIWSKLTDYANEFLKIEKEFSAVGLTKKADIIYALMNKYGFNPPSTGKIKQILKDLQKMSIVSMIPSTTTKIKGLWALNPRLDVVLKRAYTRKVGSLAGELET